MLHSGVCSEGMVTTGGRRPTGGDIPSEHKNSSPLVKASSPEVIIRPVRRRFSAKYKMETLDAYERCETPEERGSLMRREALYSSQISDWRKARRSGALSALSQRRGRPKTKNPQEEQIAFLKAENQKLLDQLAQAETINEIQKKVSELFGKKMQKPNQKEGNS